MVSHTIARAALAFSVLGGAAGISLAVDPPDVRINVLTGLIETVDATWSGTNYDVRHSVVTGTGQLASSALLTTNTANDLDPRIALSPDGNVYVAWWRDTAPNSVVYRVRSYSTGRWGLERGVGASTDSNSRPRLATDGGLIWVVYLTQAAKGRNIGAEVIDDDPEPTLRSIIATTGNPGDLDVQLTTEAGHFWVTWVDSLSRVGYSEFNHEKDFWGPPCYESYAADSVAAARARIRTRIESASQ